MIKLNTHVPGYKNIVEVFYTLNLHFIHTEVYIHIHDGYLHLHICVLAWFWVPFYNVYTPAPLYYPFPGIFSSMSVSCTISSPSPTHDESNIQSGTQSSSFKHLTQSD